MRRLTLLLMLCASIFVTATIQADPSPSGIGSILRTVRKAVIVPPEWSGIWTSVDTVYTCAGAFKSTSTSTDTICAGQDFEDGLSGPGGNIVCTGTANATSFSITCSGTDTVFTDCYANYVIVAHGTLSGSTSRIVLTSNVTPSGSGVGCGLLSATCTQSNSNSTRIGPAPAAYCLTPATPSTWGAVKTHYR